MKNNKNRNAALNDWIYFIILDILSVMDFWWGCLQRDLFFCLLQGSNIIE